MRLLDKPLENITPLGIGLDVVVVVHLSDLISCNLDQLNDLVTTCIIGTPDIALTDISYQVVGGVTTGPEWGDVLLRVRCAVERIEDIV